MKQIKAKTFFQAINQFFLENLNEKSFFQDMRPTLTEKKLLESWFLLRDSNFDAILNSVPKLVTNYDELVDSQKHLLWGTALNNKSHFKEAIPHLEKAFSILEHYDLEWMKFKNMNTLFIANLNSKNEKGMEGALKALATFEISKKEYIVSYLQSQFLYSSYKNDTKAAAGYLDQMEKLKKKMSEREMVNFWIIKFNFFFKLEHFEKCAQVLEQMKKNRKYQYGANSLYMKLLFDHYVNNKPLYLNDKNFSAYPHLYHQLMVLKNLEAVQVDIAQAHWNELKKNAPDAYGDNFEFHGEKNIFSMCLKKHEGVWKKPVKEFIQTNLPSNKSKAFYEILVNAPGPVRHEDIYQALWGTELVEKSDKNKLKNLVSRVRDEYGLDIQTKKGCYLLVKPAKKSA